MYKVYDGNPSFPTLTGLPGTKIALFMGQSTNSNYSINTNWQFFWKSDVNSYTPADVTDSSSLNIGYFSHADFPDAVADITTPAGQYDGIPFNTAVFFAIQHA